MGNSFETIVNIIFVFVAALIAAGIIRRILAQVMSREIAEEATVVFKDEFKKSVLGKQTAIKNVCCYTVTFLCKNREKVFYVSKETFNNCEIGRKGRLRYKGEKFLDFDFKKQ